MNNAAAGEPAPLAGREILLGVTGGVAAYKVADLASKLVQAGAGVTVVMTQSSKKFIGATTFEALTGRPVYDDMFSPQEHYIGEHIALARRAQIYVIAPATAHTIARLALGLCDDLVSTLATTVTCPVLVAPAMNAQMWAKPSVQRNVAQLREDGIGIVDPAAGWLSCREQGVGRMSDAATIFDRIVQTLGPAGGSEPA